MRHFQATDTTHPTTIALTIDYAMWCAIVGNADSDEAIRSIDNATTGMMERAHRGDDDRQSSVPAAATIAKPGAQRIRTRRT